MHKKSDHENQRPTHRAKKVRKHLTTYLLVSCTTRKAFHSVFIPAAQFPLISSNMTKTSPDAAEAKATRRFLDCVGDNQICQVAACAPKQMGGIEMQSVYITQVSEMSCSY